MQNQELIPTFTALLDEIDAVILGLNEEGAKLFSEGKYEQARGLLNKVESILGFRGKVLCLQDNWKALRVPAVKRGSSANNAEAVKPIKSKPLKRGLKTEPGAFRYPILEALIRLDGSARVRDVFLLLEEIMGEHLNTYDYQPLPSNPNSVRWKGTAHTERYNMVQEGLISAESSHGIWEITDAGREALKHAKKNPDIQRRLFSGRE